VLFVDIVGFTERAERLDPEEVHAFLTPYRIRARAEIERFGGTMEKYIGDAIAAVFGAPVAHEDDPERAVRAAFAVRDTLGDLDAHVRAGITTGEALVARDARPLEGDAIAHGDVVNTSARIQAAAPVDGILVDAATQRATAHAIDYRPADAVKAKGKAEPVAVWEAVAPRARLGVDIAFRGGAPLIGREPELAALRNALARAHDERTVHLVTLVGDPGIGKSRLVYELWALVDADPDVLVFWRQGRSLPYGGGISFWALGEMVKSQAGILESDDAEAADEKLRATVVHALGDPSEAQWVERHLRPLVGLAGEGGGAEARSEAFAAWRRFVEALAEQRPLVLVFEDLHWADDGLLDFVDHLAEWTTDAPLFVLCTSRPELLERRPDWGGGKRNAALISLPPLTEEETARLLGELALAGDPSELVAHAGGNPLYAEEYARMVAQQANGGEVPLPDSVQGLIAARLDTLPLEEKALLQDAAVVGKVFWGGALGLPDAETRLHALERKEFVRRERRSSVEGEIAYVFRHALVRDVAYAQIPRQRRAEKHRLAAEWIEALAGDRSEDVADLVAHHYVNALALAQAAGEEVSELRERTRLALRDAGDRAASLHALEAAARFYAQALELWPEDEPERPDLLFRSGRALFPLGTGEDMLAEAAEELLDAGDRARAAEAQIMLAELAWLRGQREVVADLRDGALRLIAEEPVSPAKAYVLANLSRFLSNADENAAAVAAGQNAHAMAVQLGLPDLRAHTLITIGTSRALGGDLGGLSDLEEAIVLAREANSPQSTRGLNNLATLNVHLGRLQRAFDLYGEARRDAERFGHEIARRWLASEQVAEYYWRGLWDEALEQAAALWDDAEGDVALQQMDTLVIKAKIHLARGDVAAAEQEVGDAIGIARTADDAQSLFPALAAGAVVAVASGAPDEATGLVGELLGHWEGVGAVLPTWWLADLAMTFEALGRGAEFERVHNRIAAPTLWFEAASNAALGSWVGAAGLFAEIGSAPDEALARLRAAEDLLSAGRAAEAAPELEAALSFYDSVGATAYVQRAREAHGGASRR
jgi:class 3 adenylate cyclase